MTVEQRLARLERTNRILVGMLITISTVFLSIFLMGQAPRTPPKLVVSELTLVNASGKEVAKLSTYGEDGMPEFDLSPPIDNRSSLSLYYTKATHYMTPGDASTARTEYEPRIRLWASQPMSNTAMAVETSLDLARRTPRLVIADDDGRAIWQAP